MGRGSSVNPAGRYLRYLREAKPEDANVLPADRLLSVLKDQESFTVAELARELSLSPAIAQATLAAMTRLGMVDVASDTERVALTVEGRHAARLQHG